MHEHASPEPDQAAAEQAPARGPATAYRPGGPLSPAAVLALQRSSGNRAVAGMLAIQRQNGDDDYDEYDEDEPRRRGGRGTRDRGGRRHDDAERSRGTRPRNAPTGTRPIDESGLSREDIHKIKQRIGAGAADWVGITPDGHVVTTDENGNTVDHGSVDSLLAREATPLIDPATGRRLGSAAKGALIGAAIGTVTGAIGGAILGAGGGTLVAPGVGTVGGGVAGAVAGAEAGAFVGTAAGAAIGGVVGWFTGD